MVGVVVRVDVKEVLDVVEWVVLDVDVTVVVSDVVCVVVGVVV